MMLIFVGDAKVQIWTNNMYLVFILVNEFILETHCNMLKTVSEPYTAAVTLNDINTDY